jgi:dihydrodipicolinate synthase/N-acetylneuraminate lyase
MPEFPQPEPWVRDALREGLVIPAHPLALTAARRLDERRQRALTRYYHAAGARGLAVGVHTTQFAIRNPEHSLLRPVLELAASTTVACDARSGHRTVLIAGVCGNTPQATREAALARNLGYHAGLLSLGALARESEPACLNHCRRVAQEIPLVGFYLQPAAGGRLLSRRFWAGFVEIPSVVAIKIAPFNRYQTLDVIRAVAESDRAAEVALYTGNDDSIVADLLTRYLLPAAGGTVSLGCVGGLLGHWAYGTRHAVELLARCHRARAQDRVDAELLSLGARVTDANAAVFDPGNGFAGCLAGISEVLCSVGLFENHLCLDPHECLSAEQSAELERVWRVYPELWDREFIAANLASWLA